MNLHNTEKAAGQESDRARMRAARKKTDSDEELTIADEIDIGSDPYNSTGRHVIMTLKTKLEE